MSHDTRDLHIEIQTGAASPKASSPGFRNVISPKSPLGFARHRPSYNRLESQDQIGDVIEPEAREVQWQGSQGQPWSPLRQHPVEEPLAEDPFEDRANPTPEPNSEEGVQIDDNRASHGTVERHARVTVPTWSPSGPESPKSTRASIQANSPYVISPMAAELPRSQTIYEQNEPDQREHFTHHSRPSVVSFHKRSMTADQFDDTDGLKNNAGEPTSTFSVRSSKSAYAGPFQPQDGCATILNFEHSRINWFGITMFVLSVFSTVFSGIYFVVATVGPRYGHTIGTDARLSSSTASILTQLFAKLIELSFVTVFVAFVGQALSRRAFMARERGVSLAELSMRSWVQQPGSMISNPQSLRFAAFTLLGACCLTAALVALLYTTAADALGGFSPYASY
jgi:hypothetical protein